MNKLLATALLATLVAFAGCKKKDDDAAPAAKPTETTKPADPAAKPADPGAKPAATGGSVANYDDYKTKSLVYAGKMTAVMKADAADCDKLATDVAALAAEPDFIAMVSYEKAHNADKEKFDTENKAQEDEFMKVAQPVLEKCKDNKRVSDVFSKF